jgi:serine protease Do
MSRLPRSISKRSLRRLTVAASGVLLGVTSALAADGESGKVFNAIQQQVQSVFEKCRGAVVRIEAVDRQGQLSGTGFFIGPNGTLYTSYTVGGESRDITVAFAGERYPAQRLVSDLRSGVAILKIEAETPFLTPGNSRQLSVASPIIAIGYPMDLPLTPAFGTIGGFDLKYQGRYFATTHIRANIPVQRGEGGAPLLNSQGEVIGVLISRVDGGSASFALPIEAVEKVRKDFLRFHEVRPGWIGVHVKSMDTPVSGSTALVEEVIAEAPAEKAGLRAGDVVLQVGAHRITSPEDVLDASFFLSAEDETILRVAREGSEREFNVTPVDPPDLVRPRLPTLGSTGESGAPTLKIDR